RAFNTPTLQAPRLPPPPRTKTSRRSFSPGCETGVRRRRHHVMAGDRQNPVSRIEITFEIPVRTCARLSVTGQWKSARVGPEACGRCVVWLEEGDCRATRVHPRVSLVVSLFVPMRCPYLEQILRKRQAFLKVFVADCHVDRKGHRFHGLVRWPAPRWQGAAPRAAERPPRAERGWQVDHGPMVSWLDPASALDLEPALHPKIRAAIYYDAEYQLLPLAFAQALARAAADLGAIIREGAAVDRLLIEGDRVAGVALGDERVHADQVVIA